MITDDTSKAMTSIVSIPMTVLGGLQYSRVFGMGKEASCFNTDDGIRRAAMR